MIIQQKGRNCWTNIWKKHSQQIKSETIQYIYIYIYANKKQALEEKKGKGKILRNSQVTGQSKNFTQEWQWMNPASYNSRSWNIWNIKERRKNKYDKTKPTTDNQESRDGRRIGRKKEEENRGGEEEERRKSNQEKRQRGETDQWSDAEIKEEDERF